MTAGPRARIPEPRRAHRLFYLTPSILKDLGTKPQGSEVTYFLSLTHLGSCWDTEPTSNFLGRGPDRTQPANWAWAAFPSRGTTKNSMQATQIPGSGQPHLSPDLVAGAASLPTPCSHLELSSLSLQSFQTQQGLSGSTLACQEGLQPSGAPPGAESWPGTSDTACLRPSPRPWLLYSGCFTSSPSPVRVSSPPGPTPPSRSHCCFIHGAPAPLVYNIFFCCPLQLSFLHHQI